MRRTVFFISDGTGITAETIGNSLLTQFDHVDFDTFRIPFVDNLAKAEAAAERIRETQERSGGRAIIVNTIMDSTLGNIIATSDALMLDVFAPFVAPLEKELATERSSSVGKAHGMTNFVAYEARINATNFALSHDDGWMWTTWMPT